ncbi:hypothetical protein [Reticulibacter mediterranei]|nr:hypothetical protein [Reticulibacter mediterranei]
MAKPKLVTELLGWFGGMEAQPLDEFSHGVEEKPETDHFWEHIK